MKKGLFSKVVVEPSHLPGRCRMDLQAILSEVDSWSIEDRIRLVQEVWDRLVDQGYEPELTDEMKAELDRRLADHRANPGAAIPWEQVKAEALARLRK
jgi:putative addiction module component (TIGR02574 family)